MSYNIWGRKPSRAQKRFEVLKNDSAHCWLYNTIAGYGRKGGIPTASYTLIAPRSLPLDYILWPAAYFCHAIILPPYPRKMPQRQCCTSCRMMHCSCKALKPPSLLLSRQHMPLRGHDLNIAVPLHRPITVSVFDCRRGLEELSWKGVTTAAKKGVV